MVTNLLNGMILQAEVVHSSPLEIYRDPKGNEKVFQPSLFCSGVKLQGLCAISFLQPLLLVVNREVPRIYCYRLFVVQPLFEPYLFLYP